MKMKRKYLLKGSLILLVVAIICLSIALLHKGKDNRQQIEAELEKKMQAWGNYIQENPRSSDYTGNKYYRDIKDLGIPAVPFLMEKIKNGNWALSSAVDLITQKRFEYREYPGGTPGGLQAEAKLLVQWWAKARKETPQKFKKLYAEWKNLKNQAIRNESKGKLEQIRNLGIAALPMIVQKIERGEEEFIPLMSRLTKGKVKMNATISGCLRWWRENKEKWLIPFPNNRPVANAGKDWTVTSGDTVQLDGSGSSDADKDELAFQWRQISGLLVNISNADSAKPSFEAPEVSKKTVLTFQLIVDDSKNACPTPNSKSKPVTVNITVNPK